MADLLIQLYDGWSLGGPCPYCGGKIKWKQNLMHFQDNSVIDIGHLKCCECEEKSELHRFKLEPKKTNALARFLTLPEIYSLVYKTLIIYICKL
jgi:hypothetical protein